MIKNLLSQLPVKIYRYHHGFWEENDNDWKYIDNYSNIGTKKIKNVCILGRQHYVEKEVIYPIGNISHLYKAIMSEAKTISPYKGHSLWAITNFEFGNWKVTYWSIAEDVYNILSEQFYYIIPETYILRKKLSEGTLYDIGGSDGLFSMCHGSKYFSSIKSSLINNPYLFISMSTKDETVVPILKLENKDFNSLIIQESKRFSYYTSPGLLINKRSESKKINLSEWKRPAGFGLILVSIYMLSTSYFINYQVEQTNQLLNEQRQKIDSSLETQRINDNITSRLSAYQNAENIYSGIHLLFNTLQSDKLPDSFMIHNIEINENQIILRAESSNATDVFNILSSNSRISDIDFSSPISKTRNQLDRFELTFSIKENTFE